MAGGFPEVPALRAACFARCCTAPLCSLIYHCVHLLSLPSLPHARAAATAAAATATAAAATATTWHVAPGASSHFSVHMRHMQQPRAQCICSDSSDSEGEERETGSRWCICSDSSDSEGEARSKRNGQPPAGPGCSCTAELQCFGLKPEPGV
jgi:hypothetical protein